MSNTKINAVTNALGIIFWGLSVYEYFNGKDIKMIVSLILIGSVLVYIKSTESRTWIRKILSKKIEK
jgi:hypothetical protein|tara:strand:- start:570 stop:770 length:201 start_codon:yes stop_codon:yes gene_type:complete